MLASCERCARNTKPVRSLAVSDVVALTMSEAREGCRFMKADDVEECARSTIRSAVLAALCSRAGLDGGASQCVSLTRLHGTTLVLETNAEVLMVTDYGLLE